MYGIRGQHPLHIFMRTVHNNRMPRQLSHLDRLAFQAPSLRYLAFSCSGKLRCPKYYVFFVTCSTNDVYYPKCSKLERDTFFIPTTHLVTELGACSSIDPGVIISRQGSSTVVPNLFGNTIPFMIIQVTRGPWICHAEIKNKPIFSSQFISISFIILL